MVNKLLLTLAVVLTISALGNSLTCYKCLYVSTSPKEQQTCGNSSTVSCSTGYCGSLAFTQENGVYYISRGCDDDGVCPDADEFCEILSERVKVKSCAASCCNTDRCNNDTPSSTTGIMAAKFTLCVMFIGAFLFA